MQRLSLGTSAQPSRRQLLRSAALVGGASLVLGAASRPTPVVAQGSPFGLGVASGDPWPDGFVIWTRLAVDPVAADGLGGMPSRDLDVEWQVATDPRFGQVVRHGVLPARASAAHTVHVELFGLAPDRDFYYRFRWNGHVSPAGRSRTAPRPDAFPSSASIAIASCANYEQGYFTAYDSIGQDRPDLVLFLGDYFYEYDDHGWVLPSGNLRKVPGPETRTLGEYRRRHGLYKADPNLQAAHAAAPWVVVPDDHEVADNWVSDSPQTGSPQEFLGRKRAALQAYYEHMPLRRASRPRAGKALLHRRIGWGRLANLHVLDTRQYRDDQACGDEMKTSCAAADDPRRTVLGSAQEGWLMQGLRASKSRWDLVGQQIPVARMDYDAGHGTRCWMDQWDGYTAARRRLLSGFTEAGVRNPVVLTGDLHKHCVADLRAEPDGPVLASEVITSSITSGGDGTAAPVENLPAWNPGLKYLSNRRGYVSVRLTPDDLTATLHTYDRVTQPDRPRVDAARFCLYDGQRGITRI